MVIRDWIDCTVCTLLSTCCNPRCTLLMQEFEFVYLVSYTVSNKLMDLWGYDGFTIVFHIDLCFGDRSGGSGLTDVVAQSQFFSLHIATT